MIHLATRVSTVLFVALLLGSAGLAQASPINQRAIPGNAAAGLLAQLDKAAGGKASVSYHAETGKVRFIGMPAGQAIAHSPALAANATPETTARDFLKTYGSLFGIADQARELRVKQAVNAGFGRSATRFQQYYQG